MAPEDSPATKRDLRLLEERLSERMDSQIKASEERLSEHMRDMQTEILKAFMPFQQQVSIRYTALETRQHAVETRFAIVERRLAEIEKKLLLDPPAA